MTVSTATATRPAIRGPLMGFGAQLLLLGALGATAGLSVAGWVAGIAYGIERLCHVVKASHKQLATKIRENVLQSVRDHIGDQQLLDDLSLLVVKHA